MMQPRRIAIDRARTILAGSGTYFDFKTGSRIQLYLPGGTLRLCSLKLRILYAQTPVAQRRK
jgi:hypothetical protein